MLRLSPDDSFHFELLRLLAHATYGGADVGEVLAIASEITPGDFESFHDAFDSGASKQIDESGLIRDAMFRASTYYRAADFYLHGNWEDPRILSLWGKQTACFDQAISRLPSPGCRSAVKGPGFDIPVILFPALLGNGYDGSMEEMYHQYGAGILERGWNVLCYDGPGQICARRYQGIGFTHEWETVVSPVLDFLETLPIVNMKQIGIVGNSMAGLLAARAAAFDHRIAAVFSIDGLFNLMDTPVFDIEKGLARYSGVQDFAAAEKIFTDPSVPTTARWALSHGSWAFKVRTPAEYLEKASHFNLKDIADTVQCPIFVADAADDHFFKGQPEAMRGALGNKAHYVVFTADDAAGDHCHVGAARYTNQVMLDWFEEKIIRT
ncbi:Alpha/Beta hydrolase protein [Colletotrichum acutatum]|uniref:Alpha/Beta hydrolase protein n=1 Tax=Glomerella acutata TaxID=27357 RepID=A0AAD8XDL6_GLOAC|nr:Alpha/Beta hydrolase protein [Colletotrichum acutatum]KAK1714119.1 Alpha/Beta hydrolase protein [Colletotrichum acutatum]